MNATAALLALTFLATLQPDPEAQRASRAVYESTLEAVHQGVKTADLSGHSTTTEFTEDVIRRVRSKLEVWDTLH